MGGHRRAVWRWVWCWLSVLVAACVPRDQVGTVTPPMLATLHGYSPGPPTATPFLRVPRTPSPGVEVATSTNTNQNATPSLLPSSALPPPSCYNTAAGGRQCLGVVRNTLNVTISGVRLRVSLVSADGTPLMQQEIVSARRLIRPGEDSPYSVLFANNPTTAVGPVVELIDAHAIPNLESAAIALDVQNVQTTSDTFGYHVQATIHNPAAYAVNVAVVVTLFDATGHILAFRQLEPGLPLSPDDSTPITLDLMPMAGSVARNELFADGFQAQ